MALQQGKEFFTKEEKANVDLKGSFLFTLKVLIF